MTSSCEAKSLPPIPPTLCSHSLLTPAIYRVKFICLFTLFPSFICFCVGLFFCRLFCLFNCLITIIKRVLQRGTNRCPCIFSILIFGFGISVVRCSSVFIAQLNNQLINWQSSKLEFFSSFYTNWKCYHASFSVQIRLVQLCETHCRTHLS